MERYRPNPDPELNTPVEAVPETPLLPKVEVDEAIVEKMELQARVQRAEVRGAHPHDPSRLNPYQKARKAEVVRRKNRIGEAIQQGATVSESNPNDLEAIDREIAHLTEHPADQWPSEGDEVEFVPFSPLQFAASPPTLEDKYGSILESLVEEGEISRETVEDFMEAQMLGNANGPEPTPIRNLPFIQPSRNSPIVEDSYEPDSRP